MSTATQREGTAGQARGYHNVRSSACHHLVRQPLPKRITHMNRLTDGGCLQRNARRQRTWCVLPAAAVAAGAAPCHGGHHATGMRGQPPMQQYETARYSGSSPRMYRSHARLPRPIAPGSEVELGAAQERGNKQAQRSLPRALGRGSGEAVAEHSDAAKVEEPPAPCVTAWRPAMQGSKRPWPAARRGGAFVAPVCCIRVCCASAAAHRCTPLHSVAVAAAAGVGWLAGRQPQQGPWRQQATLRCMCAVCMCRLTQAGEMRVPQARRVRHCRAVASGFGNSPTLGTASPVNKGGGVGSWVLYTHVRQISCPPPL